MRALVEEVVGTVSVTQVVQLPGRVGWASSSDCILINENLYRSHVAGKVASVLVRLGQLRRRDLCLMARRLGRAVPEPLLQLEEIERFFRVVKL